MLFFFFLCRKDGTYFFFFLWGLGSLSYVILQGKKGRKRGQHMPKNLKNSSNFLPKGRNYPWNIDNKRKDATSCIFLCSCFSFFLHTKIFLCCLPLRGKDWKFIEIPFGSLQRNSPFLVFNFSFRELHLYEGWARRTNQGCTEKVLKITTVSRKI